jgi:hypothetical protein
MATAVRKNFETPDETRQISDGQVEIVSLGDVTGMRGTFNPGWMWSTSVKPIAGTDSCQVNHIGYQFSGRLGVRLDDGSEVEYGPGDAYNIPPGHDAWVIGDEPVVSVDFRGGETYAKPRK